MSHKRQDTLNHILRQVRALEKQFDGGREQLQLHRVLLLRERFEKILKELRYNRYLIRDLYV